MKGRRAPEKVDLSFEPGGDTPWVAIVVMVVAVSMLVATQAAPDGRTLPRYVIVGLFALTSVSDLVKERMAFGRGDSVTLFGSLLTLAVTLAAGLVDARHTGAITPLSAGSMIVALLVLGIVTVSVRRRLNRAHPP